MLEIITNGCTCTYDQVGMSKLVPVQMHYNPRSIAYVISLKAMTDIPGARVKMDTDVERSIIVSFKNGAEIKFQECKHGLYFSIVVMQVKILTTVLSITQQCFLLIC